MINYILAALLIFAALFFAAAASTPLWSEPPHDAHSEEWVSRTFAILAVLAAFAAGLLL